MPTLGAPLDLAKYEARNLRAHVLGAAPSSPVTGQMYYNSGDNTLYWWDGTQWVSARGGGAAVSDATTSSKGIVQLAGDLAGTAASPQIAAGVITDAEVNAANKDGIGSTPSLRTLDGGANSAMSANRRLDFITPPQASLSLNNQTIINLLDPVGDSDAANKRYVDTTAQGLDAKQSVRVASDANYTYPFTGALNIDGGGPAQPGDRYLMKNQSTQSQNGIWIAAAGAWSRAPDADTWTDIVSAYVFVEAGAQADTGWVCTADAGGTIGSTANNWVQFSGAGQITAGTGMTKSGNTLNVGAGTGITANADDIQVANGGIGATQLANGAVDLGGVKVMGTLPTTQGGTSQQTAKAARETAPPNGLGAAGYYSNSATHGAGTTISITAATHGLRATRGIHVQVQDNATGNVEIPDISVAANGDVTVTYGASVSANSKLVTLVG